MYLCDMAHSLEGCEAIGFSSDAMSRIVNSILLETGAPNRIMRGSVTFASDKGDVRVEDHHWVEIEVDGIVIVVDYAIKKRLGDQGDLPCGLFLLTRSTPLRYQGLEVASTYTPDLEAGKTTEELERELAPYAMVPQPGISTFVLPSLAMH